MSYANGTDVFAEIKDEIVRYLFEDIARLPIITNRAQELWLGIQLRAPSQLPEGLVAQEVPLDPDSNLLGHISEQFEAAWTDLAHHADYIFGPNQVRVTVWANELLVARSSIYEMVRSRLRRFINKMDTVPSASRDELDRLRELTSTGIELLALLPDTTLHRLIAYHNNLDSLPDAQQIAIWLAKDTTNEKIAHDALADAKRATEQLSTGYIRYVLRVARNYVDSPLDFGDLVQAGFMGLWRAAEKFDYRQNVRFGTYATTWIWQSIGRSIADDSHAIRLPAHVHESQRILQKAVEAHDDGWSDPLQNPQVLEDAKLLVTPEPEDDYFSDESAETDESYSSSVKRAKYLLSLGQEPISLDSTVRWDVGSDQMVSGQDLGECLPSTLRVEAEVDQEMGLEWTAKILAPLAAREREVMEYRCGLKDGKAYTLEEVGQIYGLSRERIRQIEAGAKRQLNNRFLKWPDRGLTLDSLLPTNREWNIAKPRIPANRPIGDIIHSLSPNGTNTDSWAALDRLIDALPHSTWRSGSRELGTSGRTDELTAALNTLGAPAHYHDILELANELHATTSPINDAYAYARLISDEKVFIPLGEGVFSLVTWELARTSEAEPVLPFCPPALPDPPDFENALFESAMVAHEILRDTPRASAFLDRMLAWSKAPRGQKNWTLQGIFNTYYLIGLLPYTVIFTGEDPHIHSTLPTGNINVIRHACLEKLTRRLVVMPEFWWLLKTLHPIRPKELGEQFSDLHPHDLDDALPRLRLLAGLGAVTQSTTTEQYRLTALGEQCARTWGRADESIAARPIIVEPPAADTLFDFAFWE